MKLFTSKLLPSTLLTHAFTCRTGGNGRAPYCSNNMAFHVGDHPAVVTRNHLVLAAQLQYRHHVLATMKQLHSNRVMVVSTSNSNTLPPECDALITNQIDLPLMVMTADCTPILLYDPDAHAIAAIHAGRAGAFQNIIKNSITMMAEHFDSKSENIIAVLGPSICQNCYEVNEKIYEEAKHLRYDNTVLQKEDRFFLHVNQILVQQLQECGVAKSHIEVMQHCTSCEHHTFFSYRADSGTTGRQAGIIMLRS